MTVRIGEDWLIHAEEVMEVALPASAVWGQMRDVRRFLSLDPLHVEVLLTPAHTAGQACGHQGSALVLKHRFLGMGVDRVGRVLRWDEGRGFAVSDLSRRGVRVGFPHVCRYDVEPLSDDRARLRVSAIGKWTATWMPRWLVRAWMSWVLMGTRLRIDREMQATAFMRARALADRACTPRCPVQDESLPVGRQGYRAAR